jgi:hypothetical protein
MRRSAFTEVGRLLRLGDSSVSLKVRPPQLLKPGDDVVAHFAEWLVNLNRDSPHRNHLLQKPFAAMEYLASPEGSM